MLYRFLKLQRNGNVRITINSKAIAMIEPLEQPDKTSHTKITLLTGQEIHVTSPFEEIQYLLDPSEATQLEFDLYKERTK